MALDIGSAQGLTTLHSVRCLSNYRRRLYVSSINDESYSPQAGEL